MPRRSYLLDGCDSMQAGRGMKSLKAKDIVVLCLNATGSFKIPPLMIGTAKTPHGFRDSPPPIHYTHQCNAWLDREKYKHWWYNILLPHIRQWTSDPAALVMDNFSGQDMHGRSKRPGLCVSTACKEYSHLPALDQGIISILKTQYKYQLLNKVIEAADHYDELQVLAKHVSAGRKGLKYGCPAHVLDAAEIFKGCFSSCFVLGKSKVSSGLQLLRMNVNCLYSKIP